MAIAKRKKTLSKPKSSRKKALSKIAQLVAELPVANVERAQRYYRDTLGFKIEWLYPDKSIGAVSRGEAAIFLRKQKKPFSPCIHWIFAPALDKTYGELQASGAKIVDPLEQKPWGLRQFTIQDFDGHLFHFHCH